MAFLLGAALIFSGCKKDTVQQPPQAQPAANGALQDMARTYTDSETDKIVEDAQTFQQYANDVRAGITPNAGALAASYLPEDAVFLLESTTNYYYGRPNYCRPKDTTSFSNTITLSSDKISLSTLAGSYNSFRSQFKSFYEGFSGEKSFGFTDFDFNTSTKALVAVVDVRTGAENALVRSWVGGHTDQTFASGKFYTTDWYYVGLPNQCAPYTIYTAPTVSMYVRQNLGFYDQLMVSTNDPIPVAINVVSKRLNFNDPEAQTSNSNPHSNYEPSVVNYKRFLTLNKPYSGFITCAADDAMNFYRSEQKQMIVDVQTAIGKKCIKYDLSPNWVIPQNNSSQNFYNESLPVNQNFAGLQLANIIYIPSPNVATF